MGGLRCTPTPAKSVVAGDCLVDEAGRAYLVTERGLGVVHTQDMHVLADALEAGVCKPRPCEARQLELRTALWPARSEQKRKTAQSLEPFGADANAESAGG
jgi:hypothetical protein